MTPLSFATATPAQRRGLAGAIRALPHTAFMLVVLAVASSTVAVANVPVPSVEGSGGVVQIEPDALAAPVELEPDAAVVQAKPRRARCMACGVVESIRWMEPAGDLPAAFEFTVRLRDGSTRISSSSTQDKWRSGDRVMLMGGLPPSTL